MLLTLLLPLLTLLLLPMLLPLLLLLRLLPTLLLPGFLLLDFPAMFSQLELQARGVDPLYFPSLLAQPPQKR